MDENIPYMNSVKKLHAMLDKIQNAGVPETFNFKSLADYADFTGVAPAAETPAVDPKGEMPPAIPGVPPIIPPKSTDIGLVYRFEIHLPDTQNVDTFASSAESVGEGRFR